MDYKSLKTKLDEAGYGRNRGYAHGFASPHAPSLGRRHREDDEGWDREPQHKPADVPHAVHINGKKWKSFGSQSHAQNVANKIKGATVHKEEFELEEGAGDVQYSSDYKLSASGRKVKARRLEFKNGLQFKNGEDDREKNVRNEQAPVAPSIGVHRIAVTTSEPDHPMVSKRKETVQKFVRVTAHDKDKAIEQGMKHFKKKGFKVHGAEHVGMIHEEAKCPDCGKPMSKCKCSMHEEVELDEVTTGATKLVHTRTGADGAMYHIMQDSPSDFSIHREHKGKTKHIDTYGSLSRAKSVLDNEVKEEVEIEEKLNPSMGAGEYIKDFQKSDAPQFKGKTKEKKRMMGIAAYMAAKKSMKEEAELEEAESHQSKTTMKHIPNASPALKKAAKDIKPGIKGYRDRIAMLKAGGVKEEVEQLDEKIYADDYHATSEVSQFGGHRPHVISKDTGKTMFLGQHSYKTPKNAIEHAQAYLHGYAKTGMHGGDRASQAYATANKHNIHEELKGGQKKLDKNKNGKLDAQDFKKLRGEELEEAFINGREYASHNLMHPDHAKMDIHKVSGQYVDFYASKTGNKMQGKVTKNDGKSVHIQAHKELGDGKLHKFKVTPNLPKQQNEGNDMLTYKNFIAQLNEIKMADLPRRTVKGSYGTSYQGDDEEDDEKPAKPAGEKRGRGRPAGSGSGARQKGSGSGKSYGGIATHSLHLPNSNK